MNKIHLVYILDHTMGYGENFLFVGAFTDIVKADEAKKKVLKTIINAKRNNPEAHISIDDVDICDVIVDLDEYYDIFRNKNFGCFDSRMKLGGYVE